MGSDRNREADQSGCTRFAAAAFGGRWLVGIGLLVSLVVATGIAVAAGVSFLQGLAVGSLLVIASLLAALAVRRHGTVLHPCTIVGLLLMANGLIGYLLYPTVREYGPISFQGFRHAEASVATLTLFLIVGITVIATGVIASRGEVGYPGLKIDIGNIPQLTRRLLLLGVVAATAVYFLGSNIPALFDREAYLEHQEGVAELYRIGSALQLPAILVAWVFILSDGSTKLQWWTAAGVLLAIFVLDLAAATRALVLFPLTLLLAYWLTKGRVPPLRTVATGIAIALVLHAAPLYLRAGTEEGRHGLLPYGSMVVSDPGAVFAPNIQEITQNALQGVPTTTYVRQRGELEPSDLWGSLNPLPNRYTGFDPEAQQFIVEPYIPVNTIGMLASLGMPLVIAYYLVIGGTLALLWGLGHRTRTRATIARPFLVSGGLIIALMSLQYPLRTSFRLTVVLVIAMGVLIWLEGRLGAGRGMQGASVDGVSRGKRS